LWRLGAEYPDDVDSGNWTGEAWPGPRARAGTGLPRIEDLSAAAEGYERESVRAAFDSFYRHIAQVDSTLRTLEAVDVFRDQAGELRRELRALRAAGWAQQPWARTSPARVSPGLPEWFPRVAVEAAFLILVAVVVAVTGFDRLSIVLVMALAWVIVGIVEWAASRERFTRPRAQAAERDQPAPVAAVLRVLSHRRSIGAAEPEDAERAGPAEAEAVTEQRPAIVMAEEAHPEPATPAPERPAEPRWRPAFPALRIGRRRTLLVGLVAVAVPAGIASASLMVAARDGQPAAALAPVPREGPWPRPIGAVPAAREGVSAGRRTSAVVQATRGDSWVEVREDSAEGMELYAGLLAHGRTVRARSDRVWLRLGAAANVDVRVNGERVEPLVGTIAVLLTPRGVARRSAA
jgi:hypothetical protein